MAIHTRLSTALFALFALLAGLAGLVALAGPASAEDGYTYWGYYHLTGDQWQASSKGAGDYTAQNGDVEGFRYATTLASSPVPNRPPRAMPSFQDICAGTEPGQGEKRLGIVLDYGTPQDAAGGDSPPRPEAACAVVPADATTQQALESVKPLRIEEGLMCAIDGYPSSGCAEQVKNATVPQSEQPVDVQLPAEDQAAADQAPASEQEPAGSSIPWPLVAIGAVVLILAAGAVVLARRRA